MREVYYGRISTEEQNDASQYDDALEQGVSKSNTFIEAVSGFHTKPEHRDQWQRAMIALDSGGTLHVRWVDRISRNYRDASDTIKRLLDKGISIHCTLTGLKFDASLTDPLAMAMRDGFVGMIAAMGHADYLNRREMQARGVAANKDAMSKHPNRVGLGKYVGKVRENDYADIRTWRADNGANGQPATIAATAAHFKVGMATVKRACAEGKTLA